MELLVELIVGISWPATILILAFTFRREAITLFSRITRLRYKELEADFEETIRELKAEAPVELAVLGQKVLPASWVTQRKSELLELAEISPRAAVLESWLEVEKAVRDLTIAVGILESPKPHDQMRELVESGVVPAMFLESIDELRRLRNTAAHSTDFGLPAQLVQSYVEYSLSIVDALEAIKESRRGELDAS